MTFTLTDFTQLKIIIVKLSTSLVKPQHLRKTNNKKYMKIYKETESHKS